MEWKVLQPGERFEERYRIESVLGVGGFAHVYRATQVDLDREVAIKVLRPAQGKGTDSGSTQEQKQNEILERWIQRFRREAKIISRLRDPHTITMYDYGITDSGVSYMVFEYVSGQSLDVYCKQGEVFAPERVVSILKQSLLSLQEAHALGILHRDIKPANILIYDHVGRRDQVKVLDFGIAKPMMEDQHLTQADLTTDGTILGTPRYMAPEQLKGEEMGPASDIYSLGLVAYELLCGQKAVAGNSAMTVISKQLSTDAFFLPPKLEVQRGLRSIIECMLAKDVQERYQSAAQVLEALEYWQEDRELGVQPATVMLESTSVPMPSDTSVTMERRRGPDSTGDLNDPSSQAGTKKIHPALLGVGALTAIVIVLAVLAIGQAEGDGQVDEPAQPVAQETLTPPQEQPTAEAPVERRTMEVVSEPAGAAISIGERDLGASPATIEVQDLEWPTTIVAVLDDGRRAEKTLDGPRERLQIVLPAVAAPEPEPQRTAPTQRQQPRRAAPEPVRQEEPRQEEPRQEEPRQEPVRQEQPQQEGRAEQEPTPQPREEPRRTSSPFIPLD